MKTSTELDNYLQKKRFCLYAYFQLCLGGGPSIKAFVLLDLLLHITQMVITQIGVSLSIFCMELIQCTYEIKCNDDCDVFFIFQVNL